MGTVVHVVDFRREGVALVPSAVGGDPEVQVEGAPAWGVGGAAAVLECWGREGEEGEEGDGDGGDVHDVFLGLDKR